MSPRPVAAMRQIASAEKCYRTTMRGADPVHRQEKAAAHAKLAATARSRDGFQKKMVRPRDVRQSAYINEIGARCGRKCPLACANEF